MPKNVNKRNKAARKRAAPYPTHNRGAKPLGISEEPRRQTAHVSGQQVNLRKLNVFGLSSARVTLRYADVIDVGTFGTSVVGYDFTANGLFDPDITGTGHQPMGFDQMMSFFRHYTVIGSKIIVSPQKYGDDAGVTSWVAVTVQRGGSGLTSWSRLLENGNCVMSPLGSGADNAGPLPGILQNSVNVGAFQGVPDPMDDDTLKGDSGSNPATLISYAINFYASATTTGHGLATIVVEYDAVFTEPLQMAQS